MVGTGLEIGQPAGCHPAVDRIEVLYDAGPAFSAELPELLLVLERADLHRADVLGGDVLVAVIVERTWAQLELESQWFDFRPGRNEVIDPRPLGMATDCTLTFAVALLSRHFFKPPKK